VVIVLPNAKFPSSKPVIAHALEFSLPAVEGSGEKPAAVKAVWGLVPTLDWVALLKSINTEGLAFVSFVCA
jgi:hypothetical protein